MGAFSALQATPAPPEKLELAASDPTELVAWVETLQAAIAAAKGKV